MPQVPATLEFRSPEVSKLWLQSFVSSLKKVYEQFARAFNAEQLNYQFQTLTDGATITWDFEGFLNRNAKVTITDDRTLSILNSPEGATGVLKVQQDGTGGHSLTLPAGDKVVNGGSGVIVLTAAANAEDILTFVVIDSVRYWSYGKNYS